MEGAHHLDVSSIQAKRMINIDSEEEGTIICGCAGGVRSTCSIPVSFHPITEAGSLMRLSVGGFTYLPSKLGNRLSLAGYRLAKKVVKFQ